MPGTSPPVGVSGPLNPWWNAVISAIRELQASVKALQAGAQQTVTVDQYGNAVIISGQLDQIVTIGAGFQQPGVLVGTNLPATGQPNAGLAVQQGLATGTITVAAGSTGATLDSTISGAFTSGQVIGAANVSDPTSGLATSAIVPGTTFTIVGSAITLSRPAVETGSGLYCAACSWRSLQSFTYP